MKNNFQFSINKTLKKAMSKIYNCFVCNSVLVPKERQHFICVSCPPPKKWSSNDYWTCANCPDSLDHADNDKGVFCEECSDHYCICYQTGDHVGEFVDEDMYPGTCEPWVCRACLDKKMKN